MMIAGLNSNLHNVGRGESSVRTPHGCAVVDAQIGLVALMSAEVRDSVLPKIKTLLTDGFREFQGSIFNMTAQRGIRSKPRQRAGSFTPRSTRPNGACVTRNGIGLIFRNHAPTET